MSSRFLLVDPQKMHSEKIVSVNSTKSESGLTSTGLRSRVVKLLH
ncbi:hypothetical protein OROHE_013470 [Orobanche hederae]